MPCRYAAVSPICDIVVERPMKQSANAMMRGAPPVFCWQTLSAASFAMQPEFVMKQCLRRELRAASCASSSPNSIASPLYWRLPCITRSESDARIDASTSSGSPWPNMWTPIPLMRSHFTLPSTSSTSAPLPAPEPRYG